jgi:hypothetical protein
MFGSQRPAVALKHSPGCGVLAVRIAKRGPFFTRVAESLELWKEEMPSKVTMLEDEYDTRYLAPLIIESQTAVQWRNRVSGWKSLPFRR